MARAIQLIEVNVGPIQAASAIYETEAWGKEDQQSFLNIALEVEYYGSPEQLLQTTQQMEAQLGRVKTEHWGPRIIDIDILIYDDIVMDTPHLTIPHDLMAERNFVLFPMAEIAPTLMHPVYKKTIQELLDNCSDQSYVTIVNPELV